jgi:hypothetical protein
VTCMPYTAYRCVRLQACACTRACERERVRECVGLGKVWSLPAAGKTRGTSPSCMIRSGCEMQRPALHALCAYVLPSVACAMAMVERHGACVAGARCVCACVL